MHRALGQDSRGPRLSARERETYSALPHFHVKRPLIGPEAVSLWPHYWGGGVTGSQSGEQSIPSWGFLPGLPGDSRSAFPGKVLALLPSRTLPATGGGSGDQTRNPGEG